MRPLDQELNLEVGVGIANLTVDPVSDMPQTPAEVLRPLDLTFDSVLVSARLETIIQTVQHKNPRSEHQMRVPRAEIPVLANQVCQPYDRGPYKPSGLGGTANMTLIDQSVKLMVTNATFGPGRRSIRMVNGLEVSAHADDLVKMVQIPNPTRDAILVLDGTDASVQVADPYNDVARVAMVKDHAQILDEVVQNEDQVFETDSDNNTGRDPIGLSHILTLASTDYRVDKKSDCGRNIPTETIETEKIVLIPSQDCIWEDAEFLVISDFCGQHPIRPINCSSRSQIDDPESGVGHRSLSEVYQLGGILMLLMNMVIMLHRQTPHRYGGKGISCVLGSSDKRTCIRKTILETLAHRAAIDVKLVRPHQPRRAEPGILRHPKQCNPCDTSVFPLKPDPGMESVSEFDSMEFAA